MPLVVVCPPPVLQFIDQNGNPLAGGLLFTYAGGTTNKVPTYTDATGTTQNTNPIVLNVLGEAPSAIFIPPTTTVKFTLAPMGDTDPPSAPIWTVDNVAAATTASGTMALQNAASVNITGGSVSVGTLVCTGATLVSALTASGNVVCSQNLTVSGTSTFSGVSTFSAAVNINANLDVDSSILSLTSNTGNASLQIQSKSAGQSSSMQLMTGTSARWAFYKDNTSESGSNTGSNLLIDAYSDSGVLNFNAVTINRASGLVTISKLLIVAQQGLTLSGQVTGAGASTGTLTNAPSAGNPTFWLTAVINGVARSSPWW